LRQRALRPQLKRDPLGRRRTNVSRNHSLYARLDAVEAQFATRLLAEIASEAKGRTSMFLLRRMTPYFDGRSYRSGRVQKLETLYKDIRALKEKLRGPLSGGPVAIVKRFERLAPDGHFPAREERIQFARTQLPRLKEYIEASESRGLTSA